MIPYYSVFIFIMILLIYDLRNHNKKVEQEWPDVSDDNDYQMQRKFKINLTGHYFLLIVFIGLLIMNIISSLSGGK